MFVKIFFSILIVQKVLVRSIEKIDFRKNIFRKVLSVC